MLQVSRRGSMEDVSELSAQEDRSLRQAFGRFGDPEARAAGAEVVHRYQRVGPGYWVLCDCLGRVDRPPALIPVAEAHVRRHYDPPWPEHDPDCDFYRDAAQQRAVTRSFRRPPDESRVALLARLKQDERSRPPQLTSRSFSRSRGALATLLVRLVERAGLNQIAPDGRVATIGDQYKPLRQAARGIAIDEGVSMAEFLCTYPPALPEFLLRVGQIAPSRFRSSGRPHGVLISVVADAALGSLRPLHGEPIPVRGEIAIFGEAEGHVRQTTAERRARSPYLAVCLIGRAEHGSAAELLKAYLHPCISAGHLMPVDSNRERHTLRLLRQLQSWLGQKRGISLSIKKPVFDLAVGLGAAGSDGDAADVCGPCIPDFLLEAEHVSASGASSVIVETMRYADTEYRERKQRSHALMSRVAGSAPVVEHDFHLPKQQSQLERDHDFWLRCRWTITGRSRLADKAACGSYCSESADFSAKLPAHRLVRP